MARRITAKRLDDYCEHINNVIGGTLRINSYADRYRVETCDYRYCGNNVSPLLPAGQLMEWMRAYLSGHETGIAAGQPVIRRFASEHHITTGQAVMLCRLRDWIGKTHERTQRSDASKMEHDRYQECIDRFDKFAATCGIIAVRYPGIYPQVHFDVTGGWYDLPDVELGQHF